MAHTYKKLLAEDAECRRCWSGVPQGSSSSSPVGGTLLLSASAPYALRLGPLRARSLQAVWTQDHGAWAAQRHVLARAPLLKFNGSFVGALKDLPGLRRADVAAEALRDGSSSSGGGKGSSSSGSGYSDPVANLPPSTLRRLLAHALRWPGSDSGEANADAAGPPPMTWDTLLATAEPPRTEALPALKAPVPF